MGLSLVHYPRVHTRFYKPRDGEKIQNNGWQNKQTQTDKPDSNVTFYPRVINKTDITFSDDKPELLGKGLKYNLSSSNESSGLVTLH
jgi:hypothetical protein